MNLYDTVYIHKNRSRI